MPKCRRAAHRRASSSPNRAALLERQPALVDWASLAGDILSTVTHDPSQPPRRGDGLEVTQPLDPRYRSRFATRPTLATTGLYRRLGAGHEGGYCRFLTGSCAGDPNAGTPYPLL